MGEERDSTDLMRHVNALASDIGPRGSATDREALAADYVETELKRHLARVWRQPFRSFTSFSWPYMLVFGSSFVSALLLWVDGRLALVMGLVSAALYVLQNNQTIELGSLFPQHDSQNVVGVVAPAGEVRRHVVLAAHLDSQRAADNFSPAAVPMFRLSFLAMTFSALVIPVLALAGLLYPQGPWAWVGILPAAILAYALWSLLKRETKHTYTPGANDDASGVAILLGLAAHFASRPVGHTQVWLVATGCEEVGSVGMKAFLRSHGSELRDAAFIIVDNVGAGHLEFTHYEGMLKHYHSDRGLIAAAAAVADENAHLGVRGGVQVLMPTDATQTIIHGHKAIAVLAYDDKALLPNWHWYTDTAQNVEPETLSKAFEFTRLMAERLDAEG